MTQVINVFRVAGLEALSAEYRIADILGLDREQSDYFRSTDRLMALSRTLRRPVSFLEFAGKPCIVCPEDTLLPTTLDLGTRILSLQPRQQTVRIDFSRRSEFDPIRLNIVRYAIETHLRAQRAFWQPSAGHAFFQRDPARTEKDVGLYFGTRVRPLVLPDDTIGVCVDKRSCLVSVRSLPKHLGRENFDDRWKGQRCVYRYGDDWFQIRCDMLAQQPVSKHPIREREGLTNLLKWLHEHIDKPIPKNVANLDPDGSVIVYRNKRGEERAAPTELCFPVRDTEDLRHTELGRATIVEPVERMAWSRRFVEENLTSIRAGGTTIRTDPNPVHVTRRVFPVPDLEFGGGVTLTTHRSAGARHVHLSELGAARLRLLQDPSAGPVVTVPFDRQYLILPQSASASFGSAFEADLRAAVDSLHPHGRYAPVVITYDDASRRTFVEQAKAIRAALDKVTLAGFAVVMIHRCRTRRRSEDALAAYVLRSFREERDTIASVVHYDTAERLYESRSNGAAARRYRIREDQRARASGYFRNVALNKVLLTNQVWPFRLAQPLHADVTIGIDVKNNACCLLCVGGHGARVFSLVRISKQKEQLNAAQLCGYLYEIIGREARQATDPIRHVVLHRDGRAWPTEITGARRAIETLRSDGIVADDATLTMLEMHKHASVPLRIYDWERQQRTVRKSSIGQAFVTGPNEAFLCNTGWPFRRPGTPLPLQLVRAAGTLPIEHCAEDVFWLSNLAWTRPEDCSRYPVTLRLADRFLADEASEYDEDELAFGTGTDLLEESA